jgi:nicotinate-nucleotide adenylyltransferase
MTEGRNLTHPDMIIYGGAFDPPHQGHIDCIAEAMASFPNSRILVIPGYQPAGAKGHHKEPTASFDDRMELSRAAFVSQVAKGVNNVEISSIESTLESPNYTYKTIQSLAEQHSQSRIAVMIGLDQFKVFYRWEQPGLILAQCDLVVVRRDTKESIVNVAQGVVESLGLEIEWDDDHKVAYLSAPSKSRIFIIDAETASAASSEIKFRILKGKSLPEGWLTEEISKVIEAKGLYREGTP